MTEELITPENLTKERLKGILDAAFMETSYDSDGDLRVHDRVKCLVLPNEERKDRIQLVALFGFKPGSGELERLQAVNRINTEYIIVRAIARGNDILCFTWDLPVAGGLTPKAFVLAVKRFCAIPHPAIAECADAVVE
jgi:hypothetical protein